MGQLVPGLLNRLYHNRCNSLRPVACVVRKRRGTEPHHPLYPFIRRRLVAGRSLVRRVRRAVPFGIKSKNVFL